MKVLILILTALLLTVVFTAWMAKGDVLPEMVLVVRPVHHGPAVKAATVQMAAARESLVVSKLTTNYATVSFFAFPVQPNVTMWVQSTSELDALPMTNVVGFKMNSAYVQQIFSYTTPKRYWRLAWPK